MPLPMIAGVPLLVAMLFACALHVVSQRRRQLSYAEAWSAGFACIAAGWALDIFGSAWVRMPLLPGAASRLCWLAAGLLFVQGLRRRAGRRDRTTVLQAIWSAIALAEALLADIAPFEPLTARACAPMMTAIGCLLAAVAIRSPFRRAQAIDWLAALVLFGAAVGDMIADLLTFGEFGPAELGMWLPIGAALVYVAVGAVILVLLGEDLAIALEKLARTDPLTGLWNRRAFDEAAPHLLARAERRARSEPAAVAITDIDAFKSINDRFGHTVGDDVLTWFARQLEGALRPGDLLARLGGEEFALLAFGEDGSGLHRRVDALRNALGDGAEVGSRLPKITASFGVASFDPESGLRDALERADRALYLAKAAGRDRSILDGTVAVSDASVAE